MAAVRTTKNDRIGVTKFKGHANNVTCPKCGERFENQVVTYRIEKQIVVTYHRRCVEEI